VHFVAHLFEQMLTHLTDRKIIGDWTRHWATVFYWMDDGDNDKQINQ